jgi:hypothetical protein
MRKPIIPTEDVVYLDGFGHYYTDDEDKIAIPYYSAGVVATLKAELDWEKSCVAVRDLEIERLQSEFLSWKELGIVGKLQHEEIRKLEAENKQLSESCLYEAHKWAEWSAEKGKEIGELKAELAEARSEAAALRPVVSRMADELAALKAQSEPVGYVSHDAYRGAMDDKAKWKRRAQRFFAELKSEREINTRLCKALNDENGPTFMGEPVLHPAPTDKDAELMDEYRVWFGEKSPTELHTEIEMMQAAIARMLGVATAQDAADKDAEYEVWKSVDNCNEFWSWESVELNEYLKTDPDRRRKIVVLPDAAIATEAKNGIHK